MASNGLSPLPTLQPLSDDQYSAIDSLNWNSVPSSGVPNTQPSLPVPPELGGNNATSNSASTNSAASPNVVRTASDSLESGANKIYKDVIGGGIFSQPVPRFVSLALGLVCIIVGLFLFKPVQSLVVSSTKKAAEISAA